MSEGIFSLIDRLVLRCLDILVIAMAGLLLLLLNYAVFARFILNESVSWGEELPAYILAALTFIGAAYLTRTNEHIGFDGVVRMMPAALQKIVFVANLAVMACFGAVFAYFGFVAAVSFGSRPLISLDIPMALFRAAVPLGCGLIAVISVVRIFGLVTRRLTVDDLMPETDA